MVVVWTFGHKDTTRAGDAAWMKEGGIGGFEVQPVYPLSLDDPQKGIREPSVPVRMNFSTCVKFTAEKARELGLRMDLTRRQWLAVWWPAVLRSQAAGRLRIEKVKSTCGQRRALQCRRLREGESLIAAFDGVRHRGTDTRNRWITAASLRRESSGRGGGSSISSRTRMMVKRHVVWRGGLRVGPL